jgi:RNA recognition motif-containing protein
MHALHQHLSAAPARTPSKQHCGSSCEVFVGYLPHACDEVQLFELFNQYHHVVEARIMRNKDNETLLYGFVRLQNAYEVRQAVKLPNNTVFGGRRIK